MVHQMNRIERGLWGAHAEARPGFAMKAALDAHLDGGQIKDILARRDKMKTEIDKMVAERRRGIF